MITTPDQADPIGALATRIAIAGLLGLALFASVYQIEYPASASADRPYRIIDATPTASLPTAVPLAPALGELAQPTPAPAGSAAPSATSAGSAELPAPIWPAEFLAPPAAAELAAPSASYIENVGAQAEHSPRSGPPDPPPAQTGPIVMPAVDGDPSYIVIPAGGSAEPPPAVVAAPGIAVAVPPISADQAEVIGRRTSHTCAPGQVFMPRSGCYTPGQGGPMPGAVGAP